MNLSANEKCKQFMTIFEKMESSQKKKLKRGHFMKIMPIDNF